MLICALPCKEYTGVYLNINQLDALNFIMSLFHASTCYEHHVLIVRRPKLYYTASGIITPTRRNNFYNEFISCLYMFRAHVLIVRKSQFYYTVSGIITLVGGRLLHRSSLNLCTGRPPTDVMIPEAV